jgi:hypothetical protein
VETTTSGRISVPSARRTRGPGPFAGDVLDARVGAHAAAVRVDDVEQVRGERLPPPRR